MYVSNSTSQSIASKSKRTSGRLSFWVPVPDAAVWYPVRTHPAGYHLADGMAPLVAGDYTSISKSMIDSQAGFFAFAFVHYSRALSTARIFLEKEAAQRPTYYCEWLECRDEGVGGNE